MSQKYWVCVVEHTDTGKMEVPQNCALYGAFLRDDCGLGWPIWNEEPSFDVKKAIIEPTFGRNWYLVEVEYEP